MTGKLDSLDGKKILLIALPGYSDGMIKKMRDMGAKVDYINDKPNDGVVCKTLGRLKVRAYQVAINRYYKKQLGRLRGRAYDFILVIRGEYTPKETLRLLRQYYPESWMVLYMWDSLKNNKGIEKKWPFYDRVYTFDRMDYLRHKDEVAFLPLYYYEDYLPKLTKEAAGNEDYLYDLSFIGTGHQDRIRIVKSVAAQCQKRGLKCRTYFFMPHRLVFAYNKLVNKDFRHVSIKDVRFEMLPFEEVYQTYSRSKCVMDVENRAQCGLTMRSIEMVGLKRKLITTNQDIVNYDFYDPDNICVIDRERCRIDPGFFNKPYKMLDQAVYEKYSLRNWLLEVLRKPGTEQHE